MSALCAGLRKLLIVAFDLKEGDDMARTGDALKDTPLHRAARHNPNVDVVARLIDLGAEVNARNADRWQPLHMAALHHAAARILRTRIRPGPAEPRPLRSTHPPFQPRIRRTGPQNRAVALSPISCIRMRARR